MSEETTTYLLEQMHPYSFRSGTTFLDQNSSVSMLTLHYDRATGVSLLPSAWWVIFSFSKTQLAGKFCPAIPHPSIWREVRGIICENQYTQQMSSSLSHFKMGDISLKFQTVVTKEPFTTESHWLISEKCHSLISILYKLHFSRYCLA